MKPKFILPVIFMLAPILISCSGGGGGGSVDNRLIIDEPRVLSGGLTREIGGNTYYHDDFHIGDLYGWEIRIRDMNLDAKYLYTTVYAPSDSDEPFRARERIELPPQTKEEKYYWTVAQTPMPGPVGHYRIDYQVYDPYPGRSG